MKKLGYCVFLLLALSFLMASAVAAEGELDLVTDAAYLLTDEEYFQLSDRAESISQTYECEILVITLDEIGDEDPYEFTKYLHDEHGIGYGPEGSSLILLLSMEHRDYALVAHGYGNTAFTDYAKDVMLDDYVLPLLGQDKYYEAFSVYYDLAETYLQWASDGTPFDIDADPEYGKLSLPVKLGITILLPLLIAFIVCSVWKKQMKTAVLARDAGNYISEHGLELTAQEDRFLYRTETRRKIERESSGGTTVDSSGASGRSGKF